MEKYDKDGPFVDPVVRCTDCGKLVWRDTIREHGMCLKCGNKRMRNALTLSGEEMALLKEKNVDAEFLALFEGVEDGQPDISV